VIWSQFDEHAPFAGVVPEIAARAHVEKVDHAIAEALKLAGLRAGALAGVAATAGPGLIGGVMVGLTAGKAVAMAQNLPFAAINHLEGHALSPRLAQDAPFPYLLLLASGGHCQFLAVTGLGEYRRLGSTIDDAAGEAFDKAAKALGLGFPGGPAIEQAAKLGDPKRFSLPQPLKGRAGCDMSFAGLKTALSRLAANAKDDRDRADLAAAFQAAIIDSLVERAANALDMYEEISPAHRLFVVAGGVAANVSLKSALAGLAAKGGYQFAAPPLRYCTDNGAMIALAGLERFTRGLTDPWGFAPRPRWPLDERSALSNPSHVPGRKGAKA
jgi:N6-L-threonylcarbamoyladenine synthase